jgi:hypothetical protein
MHLQQTGKVYRLAAGLIGSFLMFLAGTPVPAAAAVPSAPALKVTSPADRATVRGLDLTVGGTAQPGSGILVCVGDNAHTLLVDNTEADATTGAFSLMVALPPRVGQYSITVQALSRPLPDRCASLGPPGLSSVTRTVTVPASAILSVDTPSNRQVVKTPQFTVTGSAKHGSSPSVGVTLCLVGPDNEQFPLDSKALDPTQITFDFSETLRQAHAPAVRGDYALIVQTLPSMDQTGLSCDPTSTRVPSIVSTIAYRPDTTPPVIRPGISGV